jgi:GH25 family lysozyme M1 (1,4-beta-N-acetylmuramidase)
MGCVTQESYPLESSTEQHTDVCGVGPTIKGIDVSKYEGTIDWQAVKGDGVEYAFVRVSDGTMFPDEFFDANWSGSRAVGIVHGAYQFFRANEDPIAQADMLLAKIGHQMAADDLPPVVDVEADNAQTAAQITANLHIWIDHVTAAIGRKPIVYTARKFWRDFVGGADFTDSDLWNAQYTTALCPNVAVPWSSWYFWQYTETGTVAGITPPMGGGVDIDRWNGDRASLDAYLGPNGSGDHTCGDGKCTSGEDANNCPQDCPPCGTIHGDGPQVIDDGDACFEPGGPMEFLRPVTTAGEQGDLLWTHASDHPEEGNFATWHLFIEQAGTYTVEVYTDKAFAQSKMAKYTVVAGGMATDKVIDQTAVNGWQSLGNFSFQAGGSQSVHVGDNTGEPPASNVQVVFDAVRLTRVPDPGDPGENGGSADPGGCAVGGNAGIAVIIAFAGLRRRRRK